MAESLGTGVSRTLSALRRSFIGLKFQASKPPLDAEFNLQDAIHVERLAQSIRSQMHSGWMLDPTQSLSDFVTDPQWSNFFHFGRQEDGEDATVLWANVNGWVLPVTGTGVEDGNTSNRVRLAPPPASDARIDLVFLEVWSTLVAPNPSTDNKPTASTLWNQGNVEYGGTNIADDIEDPTIGFETTERVQVQYRIRVYGEGAGLGASVALDVYPDGLDDTNVLGQGVATAPVAGMTFTNMREELGDPSLWRAGDGDPTNDLGTVDGYVYAIPICAVFRRNTSPFEAVEAGGAANQNGGLDRNPSASSLAEPRDGAKELTVATLTSAISEASTGAISVTGLTDSGFDDVDIDLPSTFIVLDDEVIGPLTAVGATTITIGASARGRNGTMAVPHDAGTTVKFFSTRPDGKFADEVSPGDILDLRRGVTAGDWDYQRLLIHNLAKLVQGNLRTSYKQSAVGDTEGVQVFEVGYLLASGVVPPSSTAVDGPDGIRTVFSDAAAIQPDVTVLCDGQSSAGTVVSLDAGVEWEVGADFKPSGFISDAGVANGTVVFLNIGGSDGTEGARGTFRDTGAYGVRFVSPVEYWRTDFPGSSTGQQAPVQIRFLASDALQPSAFGEVVADHPGPLYPEHVYNFEKPFIVLGGVVNSAAAVGGADVVNDSPGVGEYEVDLPGFDFDAVDGWYPSGDVRSLDPTGITFPCVRGQRTLFDLLTRGGNDITGLSSELYLVLYGDTTNPNNNGVFRVIGAGTVGYTDANASAADRVRVQFLSEGVAAFPAVGVSLSAELRTMYTNAEDGAGGSATPPASLAIVFTDIEGLAAGSKWAGAVTAPVTEKMVISTTLQYHPGHGSTARVLDRVLCVAGVGLGAEYLRNAPGSLDSLISSEAGVPANETYFDPTHVQAWNRLPSLGLHAPDAPNYGGGIAGSSEQTREAEALVDRGSKTLIFRPFLDRSMTVQARTSTAAGADTLIGATTYPGPTPPGGTVKDAAGIWTVGLHMGFAVPPEFMPRFGRQDIPYHDSDGSGTFLPGINHLFTDSTDVAEAQHYIIGGEDSTTTTINSMYVQTGGSTGFVFGEYGSIVVGIDAYQGQLVDLPEVISSDLGRGMKGIQLPPHLGIARLYGVYDRRDFVDQGGATFDADRVTVAANAATNLLRKDATKQTLFILQGGGEEFTGNENDHTYIVPSDAIDIRLSPDYVDGETFEDLDYVIEFSCFGFARGFINLNNYVLCRRHKGNGTVIADGDDPEAEGARMTIPSPAPSGDSVYVAGVRTPYQGDPFMTRAGETRTVSDYTARYGQVPIASQFKLASSIQQFDTAGDLIPETPNRRALQVLAAVDFYTTLGTGKVGGQLFAGTPLDVGHTVDSVASSSRVPTAATDPDWRIVPRTFTEGQLVNTTRASIGIAILDVASLAGETVTFSIPGESDVVLEAGVEFAVGANKTITAENLVAAIAADTVLNKYLSASNTGTTVATVVANEVGAVGNQIRVVISSPVEFELIVPQSGVSMRFVTRAYLSGGVDLAVNAGSGTSQLDLTGMTERLPLGILLQDSDFLCENPLGDNASALVTQPPGIQPVQSLLPLAEQGAEYTRFLGGPGQWVGMSDGGVLQYEAYNATSAPTGTKRFRIFRGGGSAFVLSEPVPGGPIDWVSGSMPAGVTPVLKGGLLVCKALLVRNMYEEAFSTNQTTSQGDEVQMVVLTYGRLGRGDEREVGINLAGEISPTGYGEGYAAADRYRIDGRPMVAGRVRKLKDKDVDPAVFPGTGAEPL